jgi:hypothetical protein
MTNMVAVENRAHIIRLWGDAGRHVLEVIDQQDIKAMTGDEFLDHCTACGGNWGGMLLSGIKKLYPAVYEAIPENMGKSSWFALCVILNLLNIMFSED